ncbi:MAG: sigma-70 family RNA polymerase sigma factor [Candidatus Pristimantibacillus sp.]
MNITESKDNNLRQLQAVVYRYCLYLTKSNWDAEDLAQETWLKGLQTLQGRDHKNTEALMLRIAKNTWIDQSRRKSVFNRVQLRVEKQILMEPDYEIFELEAAFQSLVKHLPPLQRTVFLLRDVLGYSIEETAAILTTTEGAVKAALHRARRSLEAVKLELEEPSLSKPEEESKKSYLRALAVSYQLGDLTALVELALQDELESMAVMGMVHNKLSQRTRQIQASFSTQTQTHASLAA